MHTSYVMMALSVTPPVEEEDGSGVNDAHIWEVRRLGIGDKKVAKESRELITSRCVRIDIYKGEYKVWGEVNKEILNEG